MPIMFSRLHKIALVNTKLSRKLVLTLFSRYQDDFMMLRLELHQHYLKHRWVHFLKKGWMGRYKLFSAPTKRSMDGDLSVESASSARIPLNDEHKPPAE